jgi:uncharacterized protein
MRTESIEFAGQHWMLHPLRAAYRESDRTLVIADPHFGKSSTFRQQGVPVPMGDTQKDLDVLSKLLDDTQPSRLIIVGDFFHSHHSQCHDTLTALSSWRDKNATLAIDLIRGNHDKHAGAPPMELQITLHRDSLIENELHFIHDPDSRCDTHAIAGHLHPVVTLHDFDGSRVRVPCFARSECRLILPAFGSFTGGLKMDRIAFDCYPILGSRVFPPQVVR